MVCVWVHVCGVVVSTSMTFGSVKVSAVLSTEQDPQTKQAGALAHWCVKCSLPRCRSVKGQVLVPRVFRRVRPPPHHLIVAAELNLRRSQCSLSLHQGLVAEA